MSQKRQKLLVPMLKPTDVVPHLAKGEMHWREGYSAHALATTWFNSNEIPSAIRLALNSRERFRDVELVDGIFERQTTLRDGVRGPTQTDLLAILGRRDELLVAAVEGKVDESFGPFVSEWLTDSPDRRNRLDMLSGLLGVKGTDISRLRYQLFHRAAAAIYEAERYRSKTALLLVHSFSTKATGWNDFVAFVRAIRLSENPIAGQVVGPMQVAGIQFYAGWVTDVLPRAAGP
jgi:hypothetical protein